MTKIWFAIVAGALGVAGCHQNRTPQSAAQPAAHPPASAEQTQAQANAPANPAPNCPLGPKASLTVRDIPLGVMLEVRNATATNQQRPDVPDVYEQSQLETADGAVGQDSEPGDEPFVLARTYVQPIENGTRLVFIATQPQDVAPLRRRVWSHANEMLISGCPLRSPDEATAMR